MPRTGEHVREPGVYSSRCCSYEDGLGESDEFPRCGTCGRPTEWIAVTVGRERRKAG
jgi:hypothetical protein